MRQFDPERAEEITGVPAAKIREAARLYATTKPAAMMPSSTPVVHHTNGVQNSAGRGRARRPHRQLRRPRRQRSPPFSWLEIGGAGFVTRQHEFELPRSWSDLPPRVGADRFPVWTEMIDQAQAMDLPRQISTGDPYPLRGLVAFGLNHRMFPGPDRFLEAVQKLDFICDVDLFATDTSSYADIVLPACSSVERSEVRCYPQKYVMLTQPAISPAR